MTARLGIRLERMLTPLEYHELTAHDPSRPPPDDPRLVRLVRMDASRRPPQTKSYDGLERVELPEDIESHRLSRVLFLSAGVVRITDRSLFRAAGSAGNLQPLEVYVLAEDGLFHYDAPGHALVRLRDVPADTPPALVVTGVPWRTGWKYGERGFRHLYWDAGSMLAQTLELEPKARLELGFVDEEVTALVGVDGVHEFPLAVVALDGETRLPGPEDVPRGFLADDPVEFPLVTDMQRAGDLRSAGEVQAWRDAPATPAPADWALPGELADIIRRRGSTRMFDPSTPAPAELWARGLNWATRPVPADVSGLLEHDLVVHNVEDVPPGAYRRRHERVHAGDLRTDTAVLCLGQDLGGQGALTVFHCAEVRELDTRRYRAALLEAGVVSGRLHLAAFALGLGATGLTYFDHLVRRFFGTDAWPLLVTAVGAPAYRPPGGGLPRRPVRLRR